MPNACGGLKLFKLLKGDIVVFCRVDTLITDLLQSNIVVDVWICYILCSD